MWVCCALGINGTFKLHATKNGHNSFIQTMSTNDCGHQVLCPPMGQQRLGESRPCSQRPQSLEEETGVQVTEIQTIIKRGSEEVSSSYREILKK